MSNYCLFFAGEIHDDFSLDEVKSAFKSRFNLSDAKVEKYFSGKEIIIKKSISQMDALTLIAEIEEIGGICYFLPLEEELQLPEGIKIDRRIRHDRRRRDRRNAYRGSLFSDRRQQQRRND